MVEHIDQRYAIYHPPDTRPVPFEQSPYAPWYWASAGTGFAPDPRGPEIVHLVNQMHEDETVFVEKAFDVEERADRRESGVLNGY